MKNNPFEVMGLEPGKYDYNTLKQTYLDLVRQFSPERRPDKFKEIRKAYDIIRNAKSPYEIMSITPLSPINVKIDKDALVDFFEQKLGLSVRLENKRRIILNELNGGTIK